MKFTTQQFRDHSEGSLTEHSKKNFIRNPHEWNCVFCVMFSIAVWRKTDVRVCLFESCVLFGLRSTLPVWSISVSSFFKDDKDQFLFVNSLLNYLLHNHFLTQNVNKNFIVFTIHHSLLLFIQQWRVNDVNIARTLEQLFVPLCKKVTSSKFDFFIYGS